MLWEWLKFVCSSVLGRARSGRLLWNVVGLWRETHFILEHPSLFSTTLHTKSRGPGVQPPAEMVNSKWEQAAEEQAAGEPRLDAPPP